MLTKLTKGAGALAIALTFSGTAAHADWHSVDIDDGSYLPTISYIGPGDGIVFNNETDATHVVGAPDGSWTSGPIAPGGRYVHRIETGMPMEFGGEASDGLPMEGSYTYEPAPLDEVEG